jgi:hypothetical protein
VPFWLERRYPSDDINKFLWMVRIGGGVFPDIKEKDYLGEGGYRVDDKAGKVCPPTDAVAHAQTTSHSWRWVHVSTAMKFQPEQDRVQSHCDWIQAMLNVFSLELL